MKIKKQLFSLGIGVVVASLVSVSYFFGFFAGLENFFEDLLFFERPVSGDIVIVAIDDESIARIGQWPWPRQVFADALESFNKHQPKAVGFDVMLSEHSRLGAIDDAKLASVLQNLSYPIVFPVEGRSVEIRSNEIPTSSSFIETLPEFRTGATTHIAHVNVIEDRDNVVRRVPSKIFYNGKNIPAFAFETVRAAGNVFHIDDSSSLVRIAYAAGPGKIRRIPFYRLLGQDAPDLSGKIVFIGATAADLHDDKATPVSGGKQMPGVEIHAEIANMALTGAHLESLASIQTFVWIAGAAFLSCVLFLFLPSALSAVVANIILGIVYLIVSVILFSFGIAPNLVHIQAAWIFVTVALFGYRYFIGERERRDIKNIFSKYVSVKVLHEILRDPSKVRLGGEEKEITLLFSDIRDFTTLSEKTSPTELVRILNRYFSAMTEEVLNRNGVLDKYIGDAIMAFWGAPVDDPHQADHALATAIAMVRRLEELNKEFRVAGDPEIRIGIGIYTGPAVVGNIGSELRFDYTAIGDTVNAASRIEGLTKQFAVPILIGESTKKKLTMPVSLQELGEASVKGKSEKIQLYGVSVIKNPR